MTNIHFSTEIKYQIVNSHAVSGSEYISVNTFQCQCQSSVSIKCVNQVCQSMSIKCIKSSQMSRVKSVVFSSVKSTELCVWGYSPLRAACPSGQPLLQHVLSPRATSIPITPVPHTNYYCVQSNQIFSRSNRNNKRYFLSLFPYLSNIRSTTNKVLKTIE